MKLVGEADFSRGYHDMELAADVVLLGPSEAFVAVRDYQMVPILIESVPETGQSEATQSRG